MKRRPWLPVAALGLLAACGIGIAAGVRINWTPSLPVGLWIVSPLRVPVERGQAVELCLPVAVAAFGMERHYIGHGFCPGDAMPLLKPVAALPGDVVEITSEAVLVNGIPVVPTGIAADREGRPLHPLPPGLYPVRPGEVWVLSQHNPQSWDSRYFGALRDSDLLRTAKPLLTF